MSEPIEVFEIRVADTNQAEELEALLDSVYAGTEPLTDAQWLDDLYCEQIETTWSPKSLLICIKEPYFDHWEFTDERVSDETDLAAEAITDAHRLKHARDCFEEFLNSEAMDEAPIMLCVRLLGENNRVCSLILGGMYAGLAAGLNIEFVDAFIDDDFDARLLLHGWLNVESLPEVSDDWILARWSASKGH